MSEVWNACLRERGVVKSQGKMYPSLALNDDDLEAMRKAVEHAPVSNGVRRFLIGSRPAATDLFCVGAGDSH